MMTVIPLTRLKMQVLC